MKQIKFAIIGCGRIGVRHAEHIKQNCKSKLSFVCDIKKERSDCFAKEYGCEAFYDIDTLLNQDFDILNICTPSGLHAEMSIKALKSNKNVLCEKPMALNIQDTDLIIEAEKKSKGTFSVVKQNRYNESVKLLKDLVYSNKLGKINLINCNVLWNRNEAYYRNDDWKGTMAQDGGSLITQCSHFIDLMAWIGGEVNSVQSRMFNLSHKYIETEDTGFIIITFKNGSVGFLHYTVSVYDKNLEGSMTVLGEKGTIKVGGQYLNKLDFFNVDGMQEICIEQKALLPNSDGTYKGSESKHGEVIENAIKSFIGEEDIKVNSLQGKTSIEVMQAAYYSSRQGGKEIKFPMKNDELLFKLNECDPLTGGKKNV